jgi:hypothetical protein
MTQNVRSWSALGGAAFAVLAVIGAIFLFDGPTDSYQSDSHRNSIHIGWLLTGIGLFLLIWFVASVRERIAELERATPDGGSFLSTIVTTGGAAFVAVVLVVIGTADGVKTMSDDTYQHTVYSGVIHAANDTGYVMLVSGGAAMAAFIFAVSLAIFAFGLLPRWIGWFGVVAGVAALLSIFFFTMLVWLLWLIVTSIVLFRRTQARPAT